ncbi:G-protein coupled receptor 54-like [Ptychodera flava]|uniref:G-protein coupled receptor 54-like n=1 Tax=Ptychodera flava TaxID=63121 RepID=UPI00396A597B
MARAFDLRHHMPDRNSRQRSGHLRCHQEQADANCHNYYILNLAITDLAFLACAVPFSATSHVAEWVFGKFMCKLSFYLIQVTVQATCITLTAMSADRYYAIAHPLKSLKTRTPRVAVSISAGIWICSALIAIPIAYYREVEYHEWYGIRPFCVEAWPSQSWVVGWYVYTFVASYAAPAVIITVCYTMMLRRLWNQVVPGEASSLHAQSIKQKKKITRMVMVIVVMFFVCWLPIHVIAIGYSIDEERFNINKDSIFIFHLFANCLSYSNSCMNPFIYAFMGENFRKCYKKVFPSCFKKHTSTVAAIGPGDDLVAGNTDETHSTGATLMRQKVEGGSTLPSQA